MKDRFAKARKPQSLAAAAIPGEDTFLRGMVVSLGCQASTVVFFLLVAIIVRSMAVAFLGLAFFGLFQWIAVFLLFRFLSEANHHRLWRPVIYTSIAGTLANLRLLITLLSSMLEGFAMAGAMSK